MKVLLTGVTGFIGSHVARRLLRGGHEVHAAVRPGSDRRRIRDIEADLRLVEGGMDVLPGEADLALHLAWYAVPGVYAEAPENLDCLSESLRLLRRLRCRAVFAGTCFEYDTRQGLLREESALRPASLYAQCKDALRREVVRRAETAWARIFYLYGPGEDERRLIPSIVRPLLRGEPAPLTEGAARRDFLHVEDVASALCDVAASGLTGTVNIGSGRAVPVREVAATLGEAAGRPDLLRFGAVPSPAGEPPLIVADNARLRSTGWAPRVDLDAGLRRTFEWWKSRDHQPCVS